MGAQCNYLLACLFLTAGAQITHHTISSESTKAAPIGPAALLIGQPCQIRREQFVSGGSFEFKKDFTFSKREDGGNFHLHMFQLTLING